MDGISTEINGSWGGDGGGAGAAGAAADAASGGAWGSVIAGSSQIARSSGNVGSACWRSMPSCSELLQAGSRQSTDRPRGRPRSDARSMPDHSG